MLNSDWAFSPRTLIRAELHRFSVGQQEVFQKVVFVELRVEQIY